MSIGFLLFIVALTSIIPSLSSTWFPHRYGVCSNSIVSTFSSITSSINFFVILSCFYSPNSILNTTSIFGDSIFLFLFIFFSSFLMLNFCMLNNWRYYHLHFLVFFCFLEICWKDFFLDFFRFCKFSSCYFFL